MNAPEPREKPVCRTCKSDDVRADAYVSWDPERQCWQVASTYDAAYCIPCDGETKLEWVPA